MAVENVTILYKIHELNCTIPESPNHWSPPFLIYVQANNNSFSLLAFMSLDKITYYKPPDIVNCFAESIYQPYSNTLPDQPTTITNLNAQVNHFSEKDISNAAEKVKKKLTANHF